jgi:hypothetical protein
MAVITVHQGSKTTSKVVAIATTAYVVVSVNVHGTHATAVAWGANDPTVQVRLEFDATVDKMVIVEYVCERAGLIVSNGVFEAPRQERLLLDILEALRHF